MTAKLISGTEVARQIREELKEETARLKIHAAQLDQLLEEGGEIGKKMDFLLQEMNRETNTILSKTTGIGETGLRITELALAAKADIEKIVAKMARIPTQSVSTSDRGKLETLETRLKQVVFGQDDAIDRLARGA